MYILCPHCRHSVEIPVLAPAEKVFCPSCGAAFLPDSGFTAELSSSVDTVGRFHLLEKVGEGAFGAVYKARDPERNSLVAVKVARAGTLAGEKDREYLLRAAQPVRRLRHPAIVPLHEIGESAGTPYLVSDFVHGVTLAERMRGHRPSFREAAEMIATVAEALQFAQDQGVLHRNLKPSNIMIRTDGKPVVMDFDLARSEVGDHTVALEGQIPEPLAYLSPEAIRGEGDFSAARADIYSLGVILYQTLTGELPSRTEAPQPPHLLREDIPPELERICLKAIAPEPARRYPTMAMMARELRHFLSEPSRRNPAWGMQEAVRWARRFPALAGLLALLVVTMLALVAGGVSLLFQRRLELANSQLEESQAQLLATQQEMDQIREQEVRARDQLDQLRYVRLVSRALADWRTRDLARARQWLDECPIERRQWEWHYVNHLFRTQQVTIPTEKIGMFTFSPDSHYVAGATEESKFNLVKVWNVTTGKVVCTLTGHTGRVNRLVFGPEGKRLASAGEDRTVRVWDLTSGDAVLTLNDHRQRAQSVCFSRDGKRLATGDDSTVKVWDAVRGTLLYTFDNTGGSVVALAFSPDGRRVAARTPMGVMVCECDSRGVIRQPVTAREPLGGGFTIDISPDGRLVASGGYDGTVSIWDFTPRKPPLTFRGSNAPVYSLLFSPDSQRLGSIGVDQTARVWEVATGREVLTIQEPARFGMAFTSDLRWLAVQNQDKGLRILPVLNDPSAAFTINVGAVSALALSADGKRLAAGIPGGPSFGVRAWELPSTVDGLGSPPLVFTLREEDALLANFGPILGLAFRPDGKQLATAHEGKIVQLWDTTSGKKDRMLKGHTQRVVSVAFGLDGKRLASGSWDRSIRIWDPVTGEHLATLTGHADKVHGVAFSPDGQRLASASEDATLKIWDLNSGKELCTLTGHGRPVLGIAFSPDGQRIASASQDKTVKVWDAASGRQTLDLVGHQSGVGVVAFSNDGKRLVSGDAEGTIKLWSAVTGQEVLTLRGHLTSVVGLAFTPDGNRLASSGTRTIKVWDATPLSAEGK